MGEGKGRRWGRLRGGMAVGVVGNEGGRMLWEGGECKTEVGGKTNLHFSVLLSAEGRKRFVVPLELSFFCLWEEEFGSYS